MTASKLALTDSLSTISRHAKTSPDPRLRPRGDRRRRWSVPRLRRNHRNPEIRPRPYRPPRRGHARQGRAREKARERLVLQLPPEPDDQKADGQAARRRAEAVRGDLLEEHHEG